VFLGLRDDKEPKECKLDEGASQHKDTEAH
jgi:hypothetical protein